MLEKITSMFSGGIVKQVTELIDTVTTSKEEKQILSNKLQEIELAFKLKVIEFETEFEKEKTKQLANAIEMQKTALSQNDLFSKRFLYYLTIFLVVAVIAFDVQMLYVTIPEKNTDLVNIIAGALNTGVLIAIITFFYGSSSSSRGKDETIKRLSK